jgi:hypothetical protein
MKDYGPLKATATRLIEKFGAPAAILRRGASTGPPHNPTLGAEARLPTTAVDVGFKKVSREGVLTEMRTFIVDPAGPTPQASDKLAFGGDLYSVEMADITAPSGEVVLGQVHVNYIGPDNG